MGIVAHAESHISGGGIHGDSRTRSVRLGQVAIALDLAGKARIRRHAFQKREGSMNLTSMAVISGDLPVFALVSGRLRGTVVTPPLIYVLFGFASCSWAGSAHAVSDQICSRSSSWKSRKLCTVTSSSRPPS